MANDYLTLIKLIWPILNNEYPYYTCDGGGDGNDELSVGSGDDLIAGESGYDVIEGLEYSLRGQIKIT